MKLRAITCYCFLRSIVAGKNIFYEYKITRISGFENKFPNWRRYWITWTHYHAIVAKVVKCMITQCRKMLFMSMIWTTHSYLYVWPLDGRNSMLLLKETKPKKKSPGPTQRAMWYKLHKLDFCRIIIFTPCKSETPSNWKNPQYRSKSDVLSGMDCKSCQLSILKKSPEHIKRGIRCWGGVQKRICAK